MARTGGFLVGVVIGGLGGLAAGYLLSRDNHLERPADVESIDLTPSIELKDSGSRNRGARSVRAAPSLDKKETRE